MRDRDPFGQALAELRTRIRSGEIAPGAALVVDDLAREFRLSATPVREALAHLAGQGLVEGKRGRGYSVSPLYGPDIAGLYRLHAAHVGLALREGRRRRLVFLPEQAPAQRTAVTRVEHLFERMVGVVADAALLRVHRNITDRLHLPRLAEAALLGDPCEELGALAGHERPTAELEQAVRAYHRRRIASADAIAAQLPRPGGLASSVGPVVGRG